MLQKSYLTFEFSLNGTLDFLKCICENFFKFDSFHILWSCLTMLTYNYFTIVFSFTLQPNTCKYLKILIVLPLTSFHLIQRQSSELLIRLLSLSLPSFFLMYLRVTVFNRVQIRTLYSCGIFKHFLVIVTWP